MLQSAQASIVKKSTSTRFEDHTGMLHKLAKRGWGRLLEAGVTLPYEDVFQFMCESFVMCQSKYDPSTGFSFGAYYGRSCWNNFNKWAERQIDERHTLGMVSVEELTGPLGDESGDALEFCDFGHEEDDAHDSPEEILQARQESHRAARRLSPTAKRVVALLVHHTPELLVFVEAHNARGMKRIVNINLNVIFNFLEITNKAGVKAELERIYGVTL